MVAPCPFPYGAIGPLAIGLHCRLGRCLIVRPPRNSYPHRVIVKFRCALQMCDREGQNFGWFIEKVDCHLVAPDIETSMQYRGLELLLAFLMDIEDLEESSNVED
ncbi:hypothetical protein M9H77_06931 [Catharanthus roseus]|uniref:Uncharacterized protein n=1 Tax=Catharanthus roseus TaxID=4058 RepID=A0ACC0BTL2_CATRO|nr:hypothetical protein M9H77_06931 [Catharanthus roseus]